MTAEWAMGFLVCVCVWGRTYKTDKQVLAGRLSGRAGGIPGRQAGASRALLGRAACRRQNRSSISCRKCVLDAACVSSADSAELAS